MESQKIPILLNCIAALAGAIGQYFYKRGGAQMGQVPVYLNFNLLLGILMFCGVMGLFVLGYRLGGRISVVYPFYATTFVWGTLIGVFSEKEPFSWIQGAGLALLLVGIALIAHQSPETP